MRLIIFKVTASLNFLIKAKAVTILALISYSLISLMSSLFLHSSRNVFTYMLRNGIFALRIVLPADLFVHAPFRTRARAHIYGYTTIIIAHIFFIAAAGL